MTKDRHQHTSSGPQPYSLFEQNDMSSLDGSIYKDIIKKKKAGSEQSNSTAKSRQSTARSKESSESVTTTYKPELKSGRDGSEQQRQ